MKTITKLTPEQEIRIKLYSSSLLQYGFITLHYLINQYQQEENYEECKLLLAVLQQYNQLHAFNLENDFNENTEAFFKSNSDYLNYKQGSLNNNVPLYAEEVKKAIQVALKVRK